MDEKKITEILKGTEIEEQIEQVRALYDELNAKQRKFCQDVDLHCKSGCGSCCEHFTPDITGLEALFLAFGLICEERDKDVLEKLQNVSTGTGCPLYDGENSAAHCTVYKWRPMICRLFGAAASLGKDGRPVFRNCKWNENTHEITTETLENEKDNLVVMSDYGNELEELEIGSAKTLLIGDALEKAVQKIRLVLSLLEENKEDQ